MSKKGNVSWVKPSEPSFLRKFKNDVGYKEGPTVETKKQQMPTFDDDSGDSDKEDEMPQVVVLKKGDLSADEVLQIKKDKDSKKDDQPPPDGKIIFKKPEKRSSDKFEGITASSSKKKKKSEDGEKEKESKSGVKVKNSSLLSFGDDEEED
ncbi:hypothetical protein AMEX_G8686 [Astyanax mexicanus]|uniref:DUF4604 domain-containing protein n=2 Tax=Astyanax mexicanus TaxID=7994 RepID=A0A8B9K5C3_ASTMX|nr:hypothetical protein AMEX_G8686 [Astyanax mexicanus]